MCHFRSLYICFLLIVNNRCLVTEFIGCQCHTVTLNILLEENRDVMRWLTYPCTGLAIQIFHEYHRLGGTHASSSTTEPCLNQLMARHYMWSNRYSNTLMRSIIITIMTQFHSRVITHIMIAPFCRYMLYPMHTKFSKAWLRVLSGIYISLVT